ncbi:MAG: hypothetical protein JWO33_1013 [Caulobacteraceae bacterium]|nr:hypothetical protein [Caulobacteraceae bacterium]
MTAADVEAVLTQFRAAKPIDAFSAGYDERPLMGRTVRLERPLRDGRSTGPRGDNAGFWTYDLPTQTFRLVATDSMYLSGGVDGSGRGFNVSSVEKPGQPFEGANSFGAKTLVQVSNVTTNEIMEFRNIYTVDVLPKPSSDYSYSVTLKLPPEEARRLSKDARVAVDAVVRPYAPGRAVLCGGFVTKATVSNPTETRTSECALSVDVTRISIVDPVKGTVLREWK